jgi:SAM-dependent methyltransferase
MIALAKRILRRLRYQFILAPLGHGKPIERETWDRLYREGAWDYLNDVEELGHYALIVGYTRFFSERAIVFDIGCGHGRLLQMLHPHFQRYVGVDISAEAIQRVQALGIPNSEVIVSGFEKWSPPIHADVIIFNESLSYTTNPDEVVRKYANALRPGGKIIVSLLINFTHRGLWRRLERALRLVSRSRVENAKGQAWQIAVLEPH